MHWNAKYEQRKEESVGYNVAVGEERVYVGYNVNVRQEEVCEMQHMGWRDVNVGYIVGVRERRGIYGKQFRSRRSGVCMNVTEKI